MNQGGQRAMDAFRLENKHTADLKAIQAHWNRITPKQPNETSPTKIR